MVKEDIVYFTYKKNVPYYNVGVRRSLRDNDGIMLTNEFPTVRVEEKDLRDFKMANKYGLLQGLIVSIEEDTMDWELNNSLTDEQAEELLKNYARLKSVLPTIDSPPIVQKILTLATEQEKPKKTISIIQARLDEITPEETEIIRPEDMRGTDNAQRN